MDIEIVKQICSAATQIMGLWVLGRIVCQAIGTRVSQRVRDR